MEVSLISDTVTTIAAAQGTGLDKFLLHRLQNFSCNNRMSLLDSSSEHASSAGILQISGLIFTVDVVAPPPVKLNYLKTAPRTMVRKTRRTRRRSLAGGGDEDGEVNGFFDDGGDGSDGPFGGRGSGGGGGGGRGWNFGGFGGSNWDESSSSSFSDPAFDFVYEVICWIALTNCLHFAFKRVVRALGEGFSDPDREKVQMRFTSIC